ncbi:hypothetical protein B0J11DRAFT_522358 [Dendryphion nanum]|uniref:DUF7580 domain-containing protein n=1 Tax=Dendryphion nanum TaxID=256645 RepID=A0A9P9E3I6_9PLEO|nr:hypothetical protein B0J11DRAFT_522358 [Dendryphion nanum]
MSGLEIAGVLLGSFPLIVSGVEHWRDVAKVGGFYWRVQKEYTKCKRDVQFHEMMYKQNLKELLLPILNDGDEVARLVSDAGGKGWNDRALQERLEGRLLESYSLYMEIIEDMNETAATLRKELALDRAIIQDKLVPPENKKQKRPSSPQPTEKVSRRTSAKSKWDWETFRIRFSFNDPVRNDLFQHLNECNERLKKLLSSSDNLSALQNTAPAHTKQSTVLESAFEKTWKKSDLIFKALQRAWRCSCQPHHYVNLRLEHRVKPETCFEIVLMSLAPSAPSQTPWSWCALQCGHMIGCSFPLRFMSPLDTTQPEINLMNAKSSSAGGLLRKKKVAFTSSEPTVPEIHLDPVIESTIDLCERLGDEDCGKCMGIIGDHNNNYHLHPSHKRKRPLQDDPVTLDHVLSRNFEGFISRRQRYSIALLVASSVAQLHSTPWLRTGLTKEDVLFYPCDDDNCDIPYHEPFIRQGFDTFATPGADDCNFYSLGILLLELCFGRRLEDHPSRKSRPVGDKDTKQALDVLAALGWSNSVLDEAGEDYSMAVKWCLSGHSHLNKQWRGEIVRNVVRPLEMCQEHFKTSSVS